jgi:hypothetical protein
MARARTVVIVSPHFPPSGLPPAHRTRQFARHLPEFGWNPIVLTVRPEFYQEKPDWDLIQLVSPDLEVIRTAAFLPKMSGGLGIGDLGLRCVLQFRRELMRLCRHRRVDLVYFPCPPNYQLLLGRWAAANFAIPYVFDYIDPWNSDWLRETARFPSKLWLSHLLSVCLEPYSIRHVSHVTSVSHGTNDTVRRRYPWLDERQFSVLPYGGEPELFEHLHGQPRPSRCLEPNDGRFQLVCLGAMWEAAYGTLDGFLDALRLLRERQPALYARLRVHFLGTTYNPNAKGVYQVQPRARAKGVGDAIAERPERVPYLEALRTMAQADGLLLLGSSEPHYTPSRLLPCLHARRPLFAVMHEASDATKLLRAVGSATVAAYGGARPVGACVEEIYEHLLAFLRDPGYDPSAVNWDRIAEFSARAITQRLADSFDRVLAGKPNGRGRGAPASPSGRDQPDGSEARAILGSRAIPEEVSHVR